MFECPMPFVNTSATLFMSITKHWWTTAMTFTVIYKKTCFKNMLCHFSIVWSFITNTCRTSIDIVIIHRCIWTVCIIQVCFSLLRMYFVHWRNRIIQNAPGMCSFLDAVSRWGMFYEDTYFYNKCNFYHLLYNTW